MNCNKSNREGDGEKRIGQRPRSASERISYACWMQRPYTLQWRHTRTSMCPDELLRFERLEIGARPISGMIHLNQQLCAHVARTSAHEVNQTIRCAADESLLIPFLGEAVAVQNWPVPAWIAMVHLVVCIWISSSLRIRGFTFPGGRAGRSASPSFAVERLFSIWPLARQT